MKKTVMLLVVLVISGLLAAGCGAQLTPVATPEVPPTQPPEPTPTEIQAPTPAPPVKVVHWMHDTRPADIAGIEAAIAAFEAKNPDVDVEYEIVPWDVAYQRYVTGVESGELPDTGRQYWLGEFAAQGALEPLDNYVSAEDLERIPASTWAAVTVPGPDGVRRIYGVPYYNAAYALFYNKTMFEEAGITSEPQTVEELLEACQKLTKDTDNDGIVDQWGITFPVKRSGSYIFLQWLWEVYGGHLVATESYADSLEPEPITLHSPETAKALEVYQQFAQVSPPDNAVLEEPRQYFYAGQAAMNYDGSWEMSSAQEVFEENGWELGVMAMPAGPVGEWNWVITDQLALFSTSENKEAAYRWLEFTMSDEGQRAWFRENGFISVSPTVQQDASYTDNPLYAAFVREMESGDLSFPVWMTPARAVSDLEWIPLMQSLLAGEVDSDTAAKQLQETLVSALEEAGISVSQ